MPIMTVEQYKRYKEGYKEFNDSAIMELKGDVDMKCAICKKDLDFATVDVAKGIKTHLDCFFDGIPDASSATNVDKEALDMKRKKAINDKVKKLIEENKE